MKNILIMYCVFMIVLCVTKVNLMYFGVFLCIYEWFYELGVFKIFIWELFYVLVANSDPWSHTTKMKLFLPLLSTTILLIKVTCDPIQQGQGNFKFSIGPPPPTPEQEYLVRVYRSIKGALQNEVISPSQRSLQIKTSFWEGLISGILSNGELTIIHWSA